MFSSSSRLIRSVPNKLPPSSKQLHLHHYQANAIFAKHDLPIVTLRLLSSVEEASRVTFVAGETVSLRAEVVLPRSEQETAKLSSSSELQGVKHAVQSSSETVAFAKSFLHSSASSASTGPAGVVCAHVSLSPAPFFTHKQRIVIFASRVLHRPVLRILQDDQPVRDLPLDINAAMIDASQLSHYCNTLNVVDQLAFAAMLQGLWGIWTKYDVLRLEVDAGSNGSNGITLVDPALYIDPFAQYRQTDLFSLVDTTQTNPLETQASAAGLFYVKKHASVDTPVRDIGCYGYGAGVAMASMDALAHFGGVPSNFLDGGGGASPANVRAAMNVVLADKDARTIFVNSFGGLTKTDLIARGLVEVLRERKAAGEATPPFIVRLRGTGSAEAEAVIKEAQADIPNLSFYRELEDAARAAVATAASLRA